MTFNPLYTKTNKPSLTNIIISQSLTISMSALTTFALSVTRQSFISRPDLRSEVQPNVQPTAQFTKKTEQARADTEVAKATEQSTKQPTQSWWNAPIKTAPTIWGLEGQIVGREP